MMELWLYMQPKIISKYITLMISKRQIFWSGRNMTMMDFVSDRTHENGLIFIHDF